MQLLWDLDLYVCVVIEGCKFVVCLQFYVLLLQVHGNALESPQQGIGQQNIG